MLRVSSTVAEKLHFRFLQADARFGFGFSVEHVTPRTELRKNVNIIDFDVKKSSNQNMFLLLSNA